MGAKARLLERGPKEYTPYKADSSPGTVWRLWVNSSNLNLSIQRSTNAGRYMTDNLNDESIDGWLKGRKGWTRSGNALTKDFQFPSFRDSVIFVNRVAGLADDLDHHPDIDIRYTTVSLTLTTHSAGGLTEKDLKLAEAVDFATSAA